MATLRLIGPDAEYHLDWPDSEEYPAVVACREQVWVRGANSHGDAHLYFEQKSWELVATGELTRVR